MSGTILIIGSGWSPLGAPHPVMPAIWLAHRGHDVQYIGFGPVDAASIASPVATVPALMVGEGRVAKHLKLAWHVLRRRFSRRAPERYLVLGSPAACAASIALAGIARSRVTYLTQDYLEPGRHPFWRRCERWLASRSGTVISNEPYRARFLASDYRLPRVPFVIRTAFPGSWPLPSRRASVRAELLMGIPEPSRDQAVLIMAGGPFAEKRCGPQAIAALRLLPPNHLLVFSASPAGERAWELARKAGADAGVTDRLVLLPRMDHVRLLEITANCDIGLLLYRDDGIGNFCQCPGRLSEYLLCGIPSVASDFPSLAYPFLRWNLGATCNSSSPTAIASSIIGLTGRPVAEREVERQRLQELARGELSYDSGGAELENAMRSVTA